MDYFDRTSTDPGKPSPSRNTQCDRSTAERWPDLSSLPFVVNLWKTEGIETIPVGNREMTEFLDSERIVGVPSLWQRLPEFLREHGM